MKFPLYRVTGFFSTKLFNPAVNLNVHIINKFSDESNGLLIKYLAHGEICPQLFDDTTFLFKILVFFLHIHISILKKYYL